MKWKGVGMERHHNIIPELYLSRVWIVRELFTYVKRHCDPTWSPRHLHPWCYHMTTFPVGTVLSMQSALSGTRWSLGYSNDP